jgi:hypothetical protein
MKCHDDVEYDFYYYYYGMNGFEMKIKALRLKQLLYKQKLPVWDVKRIKSFL